MFDDLREKFLNYIKSRMTVLGLIVIALGVALIYRCFNLQIVKGQQYLNDFMLEIVKTKDISGTRGVIYDKNGEILAYNELAYSVKMEDVYESGKNKNSNMNDTILRAIRMIERNGDKVISDFKIILDEDNHFDFSVEGTQRLRFLADVYGHRTIDKLTDEQRTITAKELMEYMSRKSGGFAIGQYETEGDTSTEFIPGKGYTKEDWLKMVTIRYAMSLTSFQKYIGTTIATNVGEKTVAVLMENSDKLPGITIEEDTVRRYVDSKYFAHVLGYTGKISADELVDLNAKVLEETGVKDAYTINDVVGKSGIESYMETDLQGKKGSEKVVVDNTGKVISILDHKDSASGNDIYLTIDKKLTMAVYDIVEQKLAGLVSSKIINAKEYKPGENSKSSEIKIPIYDVYFAMFNNNIIDMKRLSDPDAQETEKAVYDKYLEFREATYGKIREELLNKHTVYNKLSKEYQVYESNIVSLLNKQGIIMTELIPESDSTYIRWTQDEVISLYEYLSYCIANNWIDVSKLNIDMTYSDSSEIYNKIVDYIILMVDDNLEFQRKFYKYMLLGDWINGKQVCQILCEQGNVDVPLEEETKLYNGKLSAYQFMMNRIDHIDITPAQLALDPCNASVVMTDVNTGAVLAMVSYPGYDNNKMANSIDAKYYAKLNADKSKPQYNFATQYKAAPGSTFKIVSSTAGLLEGNINLSTKINCTGLFTNVTPSPRCWKSYGHGTEVVETAIRDSCNYFYYTLGYNMSFENGIYNPNVGLDVLNTYADLFGLSELSGVEISEAAPKLSDTDPVRSAIGQGSYSFTTVGLARYVSTIANGGTCYNLTLLNKMTDNKGNILKEYEPDVRNYVDMPSSYWDAIHNGMRSVVKNKSYFNELSVQCAGKTGTAEQSKSRPNHALFICYAPFDKPEIGLCTRIPFGYSSDYAAQFTRDIIKYYYNLVDEEEFLNGQADAPDGGISNEM